MKEIRNITKPILQEQTLFQLNQLKTFIDTSLKEVTSKKFNDESEKIKYLLDTLYNIRDFVLTQTTENNLRLSLIKQFDRLEQEVNLGNEEIKVEEAFLKKAEDMSEQDLQNSEKKEKLIESTTDSEFR